MVVNNHMGATHVGEVTHLLVRPRVAHHSNGFDREKDSKCLRDLIVKSGFSDFFDINTISLLQNLHLITSDWA